MKQNKLNVKTITTEWGDDILCRNSTIMGVHKGMIIISLSTGEKLGSIIGTQIDDNELQKVVEDWLIDNNH